MNRSTFAIWLYGPIGVMVLAGVHFLSSFGIGMMLGASQLLQGRGHQLMLSGTPDRIRNLLQEMNLLDSFELI